MSKLSPFIGIWMIDNDYHFTISADYTGSITEAAGAAGPVAKGWKKATTL